MNPGCPQLQSRILHETGLKHKGNYERFIRDIYKRGERDQREKKEEAAEIARIEAVSRFTGNMSGQSYSLNSARSWITLAQAAATAMTGGGASSSAGEPSASASGSGANTASTSGHKKPAPAASKDPFANYSTAESLGYKEDPEVTKFNELQKARLEEGTIGGWERVATKPKVPKAVSGVPSHPSTLGASGSGVKVEHEDGRAEVEPLPDVATVAAEDEAAREEEERPSTKRWLKEKSALDDDGSDFDPTQLAPLKLKRKKLTLKEEQELAAQAAEEARAKKRAKRADGEERKKQIGTTTAGWQAVDVTQEEYRVGTLDDDDDEPPADPAPNEAQGQDEGAADEESKVEVKPEVVEPPVPSGFKKRKMLGSNAVRRK